MLRLESARPPGWTGGSQKGNAMTNRIRKYLAAATLAVSLGGGGTLLAANSYMIASTADAGMPSSGWCSQSNSFGFCYEK
jgi:hypothetical protein